MNDAAAQGGQVVVRECEILNKRGLHARAAAKFVKLAGQFGADIHVTKGGNTVSGQSIMGLMMLAAAPGCSVEIRAEGSDAQAAVDAIAALIAAKFDEE